jgi:hypothetical protein
VFIHCSRQVAGLAWESPLLCIPITTVLWRASHSSVEALGLLGRRYNMLVSSMPHASLKGYLSLSSSLLEILIGKFVSLGNSTLEFTALCLKIFLNARVFSVYCQDFLMKIYRWSAILSQDLNTIVLPGLASLHRRRPFSWLESPGLGERAYRSSGLTGQSVQK